MSLAEIATAVVTGLTGGGIVAAFASIITARALRKKSDIEGVAIEAKLPAEVDSVVVQGAEAAVLTMREALNAATARAERAEQRITTLENEREEDRKKLAELSRRVEQAERKLGDAQNTIASLRHEVEMFTRERGKRP